MLQKALAYNKLNREKHLRELQELLRVPSISTLPQHRADVARAADMVAAQLRSIGMDNVELVQGNDGEHPTVKADWLHQPGKPTVLLYAHYDVQPVDPLDQWISKPFEPEIRDGKLFARGAADDKNHVFNEMAAVEGYLKTAGKLPVNVKILFEGEEENGCGLITRYVQSKPEFLAGVTSVLVLDTGMYSADIPAVTTGMRGVIKTRISVRTGKSDLHSGGYGGAAPNAGHALSKIISQLTTKQGRVRIPGFYEQVRKPTATERRSWAKLPFSESAYRGSIGARELIGDRRYSVLQRVWALPSLDVNGMVSGFTGEGFKTVIPATAFAKVSIRLAPGMDPEETANRFAKFVQQVTPTYATSKVEIIQASPALVVDPSDACVKAVMNALQETFGKEVAFKRMGGSVPVAETFHSVLKVPVVIAGFGVPGSGAHAPNENLPVENFYAGTDAVTRFLHSSSL